jgi:hypothetical protein
MTKLTVVLSQGQSADPAKRALEEAVVATLLLERDVETVVIPHLYDLKPDGTGILCLQGVRGDAVVLSWLYPRAAFWILDRSGIKGRYGKSLLEPPPDDDDDDGDEEQKEEKLDHGIGARNVPDRTITCLDLRWHKSADPFVQEIKRLAAESSVQTVILDLSSPSTNGHTQPSVPIPHSEFRIPHSPSSEPQTPHSELLVSSAPLQRIQEDAARRWYPVIDFTRCTNCMECLDFCLFGVYGVDRFETILVQQPDNCRKGCPACSRVCPENAIIFPQHKTPGIAGAPERSAALKIDLSKLFGAPDALQLAVQERDVELVAVGRDAVGATVGMPKRQAGKDHGPKDELDHLLDKLDELNL